MAARVLNGQAVAAEIREAVLPEVHAFTEAAGRRPGLGIVLVGNDPASEIYVRNKVKAGTDSGLWVDLQRLPATATLDELLALVRRLNAQRHPRRDPGAVAAAGGDGKGRERSRSSTRSIRTKTSTVSTRSTSAGWCRGARSWRRARRPA